MEHREENREVHKPLQLLLDGGPPFAVKPRPWTPQQAALQAHQRAQRPAIQETLSREDVLLVAILETLSRADVLPVLLRATSRVSGMSALPLGRVMGHSRHSRVREVLLSSSSSRQGVHLQAVHLRQRRRSEQASLHRGVRHPPLPLHQIRQHTCRRHCNQERYKTPQDLTAVTLQQQVGRRLKRTMRCMPRTMRYMPVGMRECQG